MKVSLGNMCSFFCQFYYRVVNTVHFNEEKSCCISVLILLLMFLGKILEHRFLKLERGLCKFIAVQRSDGYWVGQNFFIFLADIINERPLKPRIGTTFSFFALVSKTY